MAKLKMQKLKLLILVFSLALCIPLGFFVFKTYRGLEQEEAATLRYFAETLFDEMEQALAVQACGKNANGTSHNTRA